MKQPKFNLILLSLIFCIHSFSQMYIEGWVYEDSNGNRKKDINEPGIASVPVSNGKDVVTTNIEGKYRVALEKDDIIFVIKPANYAFHLNQFNQPEFYYIYKPSGSPKLEYEGVPPTGKLPKSVNFPLVPVKAKESFKILVFGDPQPYTKEEVEYFYHGIVKELVDIDGVDFGISLGDLVGDDLNLFVPYKKAVQNIGIPWFNVIGNHDLNFDVTSDSLSDETYEQHFGPANYAFNHGKVHFIVLDNVIYPDPRDNIGYWGGFSPEQFIFIENDLKFVPAGHLVVIAFHIPLAEKLYDAFRDEDRLKLFQLLKGHPYTLSLSAHSHIQRQDFFTKEQGWVHDGKHHEYNVGTTSGDWYSGRFNNRGVPVSTMRDGTRKGYAFISFDKNKYLIDYKVAGKNPEYQFEIYAPKIVAKDKNTTAGIMANFFMGSENDSLFCRIDKGNWVKMRRTETFDPSYFHEVQQWDFTEELWQGKRPSNPINCTHLWYTNIATDLEEGKHTIEIKAYDMFGRVHSQTKEYKVAVAPE